jgi:capsular polysaccharide export protein
MLWDGTSVSRYTSDVPKALPEGLAVAAWKSRTSQGLLDRIEERGHSVVEIEDGMIRGRGLGANCIPPLSIVADFDGIYFDPAQSSDLETLLQTVDMSAALLDRAARLRRAIIEGGVSKYDAGTGLQRIAPEGRQILVLGQVEDDRSVLNGGPGQTNLGLLMRARQIEPSAWLIYRPHPDVEAGHRKGYIPDNHALEYADEIQRGGSISALIEAVDGIHCITSLGGFEALLRGKNVTTHGVPFYAGWGLTNDLGPIPSRRSRQRSLNELVAATLILYPTYFDPVTRLPCPPEILVDRIARGDDGVAAPLAWLRSSQGKLKVAFRRFWEFAA